MLPLNPILGQIIWTHREPISAVLCGIFILLFGSIFALLLSHQRKVTTFIHEHEVLVTLSTGLLLRLLIIIFTPAYLAPDEKSHYHYIKHIATENCFPVQQAFAPGDENENWQPPLYYLAMAPFYSFFSSFLSDDTLIVKYLRLSSVITWLSTCLISLKILRFVPSVAQNARLTFLCFLSFWPTWTYLSSTINNDNLYILLATSCLYIVIASRESHYTIIYTAILFGLALLTKLTAVLLLPFIGMMILSQCKMHLHSLLRGATKFLIILIGGSTLFAPWALRNINLYQHWSAETIGNVRHQWQSVWEAVNNSIGYSLNTLTLAAGPWNDVSFLPCLLIGHALLYTTVTLAIGRLLTITPRESRNFYDILRNRSLFFIFSICLAINFILLLRMGILYNQAQGRHLLTFLPFIAMIFACGVNELKNKQLRLFVCYLLAVNTIAFISYTSFFYAGSPKYIENVFQILEKRPPNSSGHN